MHKVIIIPGLGEEVKKIQWVTKPWRKYDLDPVVFSIDWYDGEKNFNLKLKRIIELIDSFIKEGHEVSLIGTSAGASAALNAFMQRKDKVSRVVNVCGRLRVGTHVGIHSFEARTASSFAFAESVKMCEAAIEKLTPNDRKRIMTIRPLFGDELVPQNTVVIDGAKNIVVPASEHVLSISLCFIFPKKIIDFLNTEKRIFVKWKGIMDKIYSGEIAQVRGVDLLIDLLADEGVQLRDKRNRLLGCNFFVYDKSSWSKKQEKPLCLGLIYQKPNQVKTQDIFIISLSRGIETFYSEKEMVKKYPLMKGAHKDNLPI